MARLDSICKLNMGQSPDSASYNKEGRGIPFFQGNADFGDLYPSVRIWCDAPTKIAYDGDILISVRAPIGALNIADRECCIGRGLAALTVNESICNKKYLWYCISSKVDELNAKGTGSTFKAISKNVLAETEIVLPDMEQQIKIANKLELVFNLISLRKQQLAKLDELVKSRFVEMFGDDVPTAKLGDVCRMINGDRGKNYPSGDDFVENGVPFVNAGHLQNRKVDFCDMNYITEEKFNLLSQGKMQEGDILYCLRGSLGKHGLVDFERGAVASSLVIIRCNQEQVLPQFLLYALEAPEIELQLKAANNGSSQPNLSAASVKAYDIKLPTIEQQKQFVSFVERTDKSKLEIQKSLAKLETLKKALMQKYFG